MIVPLLLLFIVMPIAELYVIIQVGEAIGALPTIAILVGDSLLGTWLLRSQGRATWRRFNAALAAGRPPAREVLDGALVIFGGAFLITPGFITDVIGVVLLLPPSRAVVRRALVRNFTNRTVVRAFGAAGPRPQYDVEGTGIELDPPRRGRR
jgi:UPF0716 protein FxsA